MNATGNPCQAFGPEIKKMRMTVGDQAKDYSISVKGRSPTNMKWISETLLSTATSNKTVIEFYSTGIEGGWCGAAIDDVSVVLLSPVFVRGDANENGGIDTADPINILDYLFRGTVYFACISLADSNDDGETDIADAIYLLRYLFMDSPSPPPPFPGCGLDPTEDHLTCTSTSCE
ncbi:MAG: hypothetical protein HY717_16080 [Planctomycetes bacterium]|nr:hypothetical protein [Planctomycetota bacterium]